MSDAWVCPTCGREFAKPRQWHSCEVHELHEHLARTGEGPRAAFERLQEVLGDLGDASIEPVKTGITLKAGTAFGYVTVRRDRLVLQLRYDHQPEIARATRVERVSNHGWAYEIPLRVPEDVDSELIELTVTAVQCARRRAGE